MLSEQQFQKFFIDYDCMFFNFFFYSSTGWSWDMASNKDHKQRGHGGN